MIDYTNIDKVKKIANILKGNAFIYLWGDCFISPFKNNGGYVDFIISEDMKDKHGFLNRDILDEQSKIEMIEPEDTEWIELVERLKELCEVTKQEPIYEHIDDEMIAEINKANKPYEFPIKHIGPYNIYLAKFLFKKYNKGDSCCLKIYRETDEIILVNICISKKKENVVINRLFRCLV